MEKLDIVLVVLNRKFLEHSIQNLNFDKANLATIIMDGDAKNFKVGGEQIPISSFSDAPKLAKKYKDFTWLIAGYEYGLDDVFTTKKMLLSLGVSESNIVNFELSEQINQTWLANLRHIEEHGADFFVTGNEYTRDGLDFNLIPCVREDKAIAKGGVNLADAYQDLRQSYLTAKHVFEHVAPSTIKFVLIGLSPDSFRYDNAKDFTHCAKKIQYISALNAETNIKDNRLKDLVSDDFKKIFETTAEQADLNFDALKSSDELKFSVQAVIDWEGEPKTLPDDSLESNVQILKDYIELCLANGAKPIGLIFPFAPLVRKSYDAEYLKNFNEIIRQLEENYDFKFVDWFNHLNYDCFYNMKQLNSTGLLLVNSVISMKLNAWELIPDDSFCDMGYDYFRRLPFTAPKDEFNALMERVFKASVKRIRRKDKIKIAFIMIEAAHWCGKELYDLFENDKRFETTVFFSMDFHKDTNALVKKDFARGVEQLKSHGLNVVPLDNRRATVPEQDILIFLTPYINWLSSAFHFRNIKASTLLTHIPYGFDSSYHTTMYYSQAIFILSWKIFFSSNITFNLYKNKCIIGSPRGLYAGYPKIDIFFKNDANFHFNWKMTRPDAKKIIWAPHHSVGGEPLLDNATFQWNYQFMYDFAKAHPEISWVVKPHPMLLYKAVKFNVFPSNKAFNDYLNKWNELPNAQVYTGGYYQEIFATSDGMIHDCGSFTSEYQYAHKPMIYLTRSTQKFNKLGGEILKVSYLVDGKDLNGIAATIQRVFIEGKDDKAADREKLFDKYLNYPKTNGMLASEFIYKSIVEDLSPQVETEKLKNEPMLAKASQQAEVAELKDERKMIKVITYGTFDLFHEGHYRLLQRAKALGDYLIVGVTTESFDKSRGKLGVIDSLITRIENVKKSGFADEIIVEEYVGQKVIDVQRHKVDIFAIGSDWVGKFDYLNEYCKVVYLERTKNVSSTDLRKIKYHVQRVGIIGNGRIANRFVVEAKFVSGANVQSVYNPRRESAERFAKKWEITPFDDLEKFFEATDLVYIASPHQTHYEYIKAALEHKKHVLCEKPMVLEKAQAEELFDYAKKNNLVLFEGIKTAYCTGFNKILGLARRGNIGDVRNVEACFTKLENPAHRELTDLNFGGSFLELGSYVILPILKIFGTNFSSIRFEMINAQNGLDIFTKVSMSYPSGVATATCGLGVKSEGRLLISGTKGYIVVEPPWWKTTNFEIHYEDPSIVDKYNESFYGDGLRYELSDMLFLINGIEENPFKLTAKESIALADIMEKFLSLRR